MIHSQFFAFSLSLSGAITLGLCLYVSRYRKVVGVPLFMALMLAATVWSWAYAIELGQPTLAGKLFWRNVQQLGTMLAPVIWWHLALEYTGRRAWVQGWRRYYWFIVPMAAIFLVWTNDFHHLMRVNVRLLEANGVPYVTFDRTLLSWVTVGYSYALLAAAAVVLVRGILQGSSQGRQLAVLLVSLLLPTGASMAQTLGYNPIHPHGPSALFFALSGLLVVWALQRYQFFTVWPVIRDHIIETMNDGILVTNSQRQVVDLNPRAQEFLAQRWTAGGAPDGTAVRAVDPSAVRWRPVAAVLAQWPDWVAAYEELAQQRAEIRLSVSQGERHYLIKLNPLVDEWGSMIGAMAAIQDNTEQRHKEAELLRLATTDQLTGLPNRAHFFALSEQIYEVADRHGIPMSVLMVDLDRFKELNDTHGHPTGDLVLAAAAAVFRRRIRRADVVGRLGGEEFGISLAATGLAEAQQLAAYLAAELDELRVTVAPGIQIGITMSVGIATKHPGDRSFSDVLSRADRAMYLAKEQRNCVRTEADLRVHDA